MQRLFDPRASFGLFWQFPVVVEALTGCWSLTDNELLGGYGGFPKLGVPFLGDPHNKDYSILGSILGSPYFGKLPYILGS